LVLQIIGCRDKETPDLKFGTEMKLGFRKKYNIAAFNYRRRRPGWRNCCCSLARLTAYGLAQQAERKREREKARERERERISG
jgi:hypothetical protein